MTKKRKPKRTPRRLGLVDYVLVLEDDAGRQLALTVQKDSRAPIVGEELPLDDRAAKEVPHLAGTYVVHRVAHLPPPNAAITIERYTIPWCYARRAGTDSRATQGAKAALQAQGFGPLESVEGALDQTTAAELSEKSRSIATDLGDIAEEVAAAVHSGAAGTLGLDLVQRLDDASRRAKQVAFSALFKSRIRRESE